LAAEEVEDLTSAQVEDQRSALDQLKLDLNAQLAASAASAKPVELDQTAVGRVSRVDSMQRQAMAQATRQAMMVQLRQCDAALQAIERGEYGSCRMCEEPVGIKRLMVKPEAPFCLECQQGADRR
jgi:DnaK suppressor protein